MFRTVRLRIVALAGATLLALVAIPPASANAAKPTVPDGLDAAAGARLIASRLPAPGAASATPRSQVVLSTGRSSSLVAIVCTASSDVLGTPIGTSHAVLGTASSTCPAPVDFVSAQVWVFVWSADLQEWIEVDAGNLAYLTPYPTPGVRVTSETQATCEGKPFAAVGFHQARLGDAYATTYTVSNTRTFAFC